MREEKNIFQQYPFAQKDYPQYTRKQKQKKNTGEKEHRRKRTCLCPLQSCKTPGQV
jgi:hypothetical protein